MKDQKTNKYARPVSQRAIAAVLAGLMLMSTVPVQAIAEEIQDAQAVVAAQTATDGTEEVSQPIAADAAAADQQTTDANATDQQNTGSQEVQAVTDDMKVDASAEALLASGSAVAKKDAEAQKEEGKKDEADETLGDEAAKRFKKVTNYSAEAAADLLGKVPYDLITNTLKILGETSKGADKMSGYGVGTTALGIAMGILQDVNKKANYSSAQIMQEIFATETKVDEVSRQIDKLSDDLKSFENSSYMQNDERDLRGLEDVLKKAPEFLGRLDEELQNYPALDDNGKETDQSCSLETPMENWPDGARAAVAKIAKEINQYSVNQSGKSMVTLTNNLRQMICAKSSLISHYYASIDEGYNWEPETYADKKDYLTRMGMAYINAHLLANVVVRAGVLSDDEGANDRNLRALCEGADQVQATLFGTTDSDGNFHESNFLKATHADENSDTVKCLINGKSYKKGTYARVEAYDSGCFFNAYREHDAKTMRTSWNPGNEFSAYDVSKMAKRLLNMSESKRPKIGDNAVGSILEEMEAMGFKNMINGYAHQGDGQETDAGDRNKLCWASKLGSLGLSGCVSLGTKRWNTKDYYEEIGNPKASLLVKENCDYKLGKRLENSSDWIVTDARGTLADGGNSCDLRVKLSFGRSRENCYARYGTVVNVRSGEIRTNQLLYVLYTERTLSYIDRSYLDYYAFGELRLGTEDPSIG